MAFKDKIALVTGSGRGIGKGIALALAAEGAVVAVNSVTPDSCEAVASMIREKGGKAESFVADVADFQAVETMVADVHQRFGGVDVLVNNAGVETTYAFKDLPIETWNWAMSITLNGAINCARAIVPGMIDRRRGNIVNIGSLSSFRVSKTGGADYTTTKHALLGFTRHLAYELAMHRINVNIVCPGLTMTEGLKARYSEKELQAWANDMLPLSEIARPRDIANAVLFLASEKARLITGQSLVVDNGISLVAPGDSYRSAMEERLALNEQTIKKAKRNG